MSAAPTADAIVIRPITLADVEAYREMRLEALWAHPVAFTADLGDGEARPIEQWREQVGRATGTGADVIMLADAGTAGLAGMAGVFTPPSPKLSHAGVVWGVYVREAYRGRGLGERLVRACIQWARDGRRPALLVLRLSAVQGNGGAVRCYERCGFVTYGVEPMVVRWEGKLYDETQMALRL